MPSFAEDFALLNKDKPLSIYIDKNETSVVQTSKDIFISDATLVSEVKADLQDANGLFSVVAGTIGTNKFIDELVSRKLISVDKLRGQWEAFQIQIVTYQNRKILVVA